MSKLTTEQFIYLLYAKAYAKATEAGTVTGGDIKSYLTDEWKEKAEEIYSDLKTKKLIELKTKEGKPSKREGRFSVTDEGNQVLGNSLATIDYDFTSSKSYKVLSTALACLLTHVREAAKAHPQVKPFEEMTFDEFQEKFKALYFEERRQQERRGAVAIHSQELCKQFAKLNSISQEKLAQYFDLLKENGDILAVVEKDKELIQWSE